MVSNHGTLFLQCIRFAHNNVSRVRPITFVEHQLFKPDVQHIQHPRQDPQIFQVARAWPMGIFNQLRLVHAMQISISTMENA